MSGKRLLILTERFFPEEFLINDLAQAWQARGWAVEVLTQVPSYPHDKLYDGYRNVLFQTTHELHFPVHRVRTLLGYNTSVFRKVLNYISFAFLTSLWALFNGWRYQKVFIYHTGPLTMATASLPLRFLYRKPVTIWTQDLWPDAVYAYGFKPSRWKRILLDLFIKLIYAACNVITVSSPGFINKLRVYTRRTIHFVPQWTTQTTSPSPPRSSTSKRIFTFAGNLGTAQNLEMLIDAFGTLNPPNGELHIVGGGVNLLPLRARISQKGYKHIFLPGRRPQAEMPALFAQSDVLIISLSKAFSITLPAKFQAYIAAQRPLLGILEGDTATLIRQHHLGIACAPEADAITQAFKTLLSVSDEQLKQWGDNALELSNAAFNRSDLITRFETLLNGSV